MREKAKQKCHSDISSHHIRNFSIDADFTNEKWRYGLLPVYLASYNFKGKLYQIMVNGQNGEVGGQNPLIGTWCGFCSGAILSPALILILIGIPFLLAGGLGAVPLFIGFILLAIGGIISFAIYHNAVKSERS